MVHASPATDHRIRTLCRGRAQPFWGVGTPAGPATRLPWVRVARDLSRGGRGPGSGARGPRAASPWDLESRGAPGAWISPRAQGEREDNDGVTVSSLGLAGPDRETSLDLDALEDALRAAGAMKVRQSRDAGAYVCERTYSHGLQRGAELGIQALFLHVPPGEEQSVGDQLPLVSALVHGLLRQVRS